MAVDKKRANQQQVLPPKHHAWKPTYELCRTLPDGSRQVISSYFTLEEAQARAKALHKHSMEAYRVYDQLAQKFAFSEPEAGPAKPTSAKTPEH